MKRKEDYIIIERYLKSLISESGQVTTGGKDFYHAIRQIQHDFNLPKGYPDVFELATRKGRIFGNIIE